VPVSALKRGYPKGFETLVVRALKHGFLSNDKIAYPESKAARLKLNRIGGSIFNGGTCGLIR